MGYSDSIERVIEVLQKLVRCPNPQSDMAKVVSFVGGVLRRCVDEKGFDRVVCDDMGNCAFLKEGRAGAEAPFLVCAYGGSFPPEGMPEPYEPKIVDGAPYAQDGSCIWGRGTSEQKGALAAAIVASNLFVAEAKKPNRTYLFLVNVAGEMGSHEAVDYFFKAFGHMPSWAIIAMGTRNMVCMGNKGRVDIEVKLVGRSCHSSDPSQGINPIESLPKLLGRLRELRPQMSDPDLGPATLVATGIRTWPSYKHTIPERCDITLDRRLLPGDEPASVVEEIRKGIGPMEGLTLSVEMGKFQYGAKADPASKLSLAAFKACAEVSGRAETFYMKAALDAGFFLKKGVQAISLGPGDIRLAHTSAEMVSIKEVVQGAEIYLKIIKEMTS